VTKAKGAAARVNIQAERRLLSEWIAEQHAGDRVMMHVYVGPISPLAPYDKASIQEYNMIGVRRRWVDALIIYKDSVELIEAKMIVEPFVVAQLELYKQLFPQTPGLQDFSNLPVTMTVVTAISDPAVTKYLRGRGMNEIIFKPAWVDDYLNSRPWRKRQPAASSGL
jgi:hypothetical protein